MFSLNWHTDLIRCASVEHLGTAEGPMARCTEILSVTNGSSATHLLLLHLLLCNRPSHPERVHLPFSNLDPVMEGQCLASVASVVARKASGCFVGRSVVRHGVNLEVPVDQDDDSALQHAHARARAVSCTCTCVHARDR